MLTASDGCGGHPTDSQNQEPSVSILAANLGVKFHPTGSANDILKFLCVLVRLRNVGLLTNCANVFQTNRLPRVNTLFHTHTITKSCT